MTLNTKHTILSMDLSIEKDTPIEQVKEWLDTNKEDYAIGAWTVGDDLLLDACIAGRLDIVIMLCNVGIAFINNKRWDYCAIEYAVIEGYLDIVKYLVENHNAELHNSLRLAIEHGWMDILDYLLTINININVGENNPLYLACNFKNIDAVNKLLLSGADPNVVYIPNEDDPIDCVDSILEIAILHNRLDIIIQLVIYGVNIHDIGFSGYTPLMWACDYYNENIVKFLIGLGCDVNYCNTDGYTPLSIAIYNNNTELVTLLLKNNVEIGDIDYNSMTDEMKEIFKKNKFIYNIVHFSY